MMTNKKNSSSDTSASPDRLAKKHLLITGTQECDGETIVNELNTMAKYTVRGQKHYIFYDEYQEDGSCLSCRLLVTREEAELKKSGPRTTGASILRFRPGTRQECHYQSPVGTLSLISDTQKFQLDMTEQGMSLKLRYTLYMNAEELSRYDLSVHIS